MLAFYLPRFTHLHGERKSEVILKLASFLTELSRSCIVLALAESKFFVYYYNYSFYILSETKRLTKIPSKDSVLAFYIVDFFEISYLKPYKERVCFLNLVDYLKYHFLIPVTRKWPY